MSRERATLAVALAAALGLGACANGGGGGLGNVGYGGLGQPGVGTAAGAAGGAALGRVFAGGHNNLAAILGGAALGGLAGNVLADRPSDTRRQQENQAAQDADQQRRLDYDRQSTLQQESTRKQIEDQRLFDEWKASRQANLGAQGNAAVASTTATSQGDVMTGQRLLTALGYYKGRVDGVDGAATQAAVKQFETAQGMPLTGTITPSLLNRMRAVL